MDSIAHRAALVVTTALLATMAFVAGTALATTFDNTYCGASMSVGSWCGDGSDHSYNFNRATYTADSTNVWVCQRLLYSDTHSQVSTPTCNYNLISQTYSTLLLTEAEVSHQTSPSRVIWGYATA